MIVDINVLNAFPLPLDQLHRRYATLAIFDQLFGSGNLLRDIYAPNSIFQSNAEHWGWISEPMLELEFIALPGERPLLWSRSYSQGCQYIPLQDLPSYVNNLYTFEQVGSDAFATFAYVWDNNQWNYIAGIDKDDKFYDDNNVIIASLENIFEPLFISTTKTHGFSSWVECVLNALFNWALGSMAYHSQTVVYLLSQFLQHVEETQSISLTEIDKLISNLTKILHSNEIFSLLDADERESLVHYFNRYSQDEVKAVAQRFKLAIND